MYTKYPDGYAAIESSLPAGNAMTTGKIRYQGYCFTGLEILVTIGIHQLTGDLMAKYPRVGEKRLCAFISMEVCSTDTNIPNPDDHLLLLRSRIRRSTVFQFSWFKAAEYSHTIEVIIAGWKYWRALVKKCPM
jgi:hypothetical protein